jgi:hypothetical protein
MVRLHRADLGGLTAANMIDLFLDATDRYQQGTGDVNLSVAFVEKSTDSVATHGKADISTYLNSSLEGFFTPCSYFTRGLYANQISNMLTIFAPSQFLM